MKFKNTHFNELYESMKEMDQSDDYLMIQVSALNPGKDNMKMDILATGGTGGKPVIDKVVAETVLIIAMEKSDDLKRLLTDAVMHYEQFQAFKRMRKS